MRVHSIIKSKKMGYIIVAIFIGASLLAVSRASAGGKGEVCDETGAPYAYGYVADSRGTAPHTTTIDSVYSDPCEGEITDYLWTLPDGSTQSGSVASYTFEAGYWGVDLQVTNSEGLTDTSTSYVDVRAVNGDPDAQDDSVSFNTRYEENDQTSVNIYAYSNDSDPEGDYMTYAMHSDPSNGNAEMSSNGYASYTANEGFIGTDTFEYSVVDDYGGFSTATVTVDVQWANTQWTHAYPDNVQTNEDESVTVDVLANDTDWEGDALTVTGVAVDSELGSAWVNTDGRVTFEPIQDKDYSATVYVQYSISDPYGATSSSHLSVTVNPVNDLPVAHDDSVAVDEDYNVDFNVKLDDTDIDGVIVNTTVVDGPQHGGLTYYGAGNYRYTPNENYNGSDSFTYYSTDNEGGNSNVANVSISVNSVNDLPIAGNDSASLQEDGDVTVAVLDNDSDEESANLSVVVATGPQNGVADVNADGSITYTPNSNYHGTDSLSYTVSDDDGGQATATLSLSVVSVNDGPEASLTADYISKKRGYEFDASGSFDVDGTIVNYSFDFGDGRSTNTTNPVVTYKYKGKPRDRTVTVTVTDNEGATAVATVQIPR